MKEVKSLVEALAVGVREHIALVGAGGKTTVLFALAEELKRRGKRVITSTTTKVWQREALQSEKMLLLGDDADWRNSRGKEELNGGGTLFVGRSILDSGKVEGIGPSLADEIYEDSRFHYLIVEADGAAGHPLKAPAEHEPVIPLSVTMVVGVMGLEAIGACLDKATAFRIEEVKRITGLEPGSILTPGGLAKIFLHSAGVFKGTPEAARRVVLLNKSDLLEEEGKARELADIVLADPMKKIDRVILGSVKKGVYEIKTKKGEP